jgi:hypothetical protein
VVFQWRYGSFPVAVVAVPVRGFSTAANSSIIPPQSGKFAAGLGKFRNLRWESGIGQIADFFPSHFPHVSLSCKCCNVFVTKEINNTVQNCFLKKC